MPLVRDPLLYSYLSQRTAEHLSQRKKIKIIMLKERATSVCFFSLMVEERASRFFPSSTIGQELFTDLSKKIFQLFPVVGIRPLSKHVRPCWFGQHLIDDLFCLVHGFTPCL